MKILFLCTSSNSVINFRKRLIQKLQSENFEIIVVANDNNREEEIKNLGCRFFSLSNSNRAVSIKRNLQYIKSLKKIIRLVSPEIVFTFQVKPNTLGVFVAHKEKIKNIFSMIEGLGDTYIRKKLKWRIVGALLNVFYKIAFKYTKKVFFLNRDNLDFFMHKKMLKQERAILINGIGVDLIKFKKEPIINFNTFIMVARFIKSKGIFEYCEAAKIVKDRGYDYVFLLIGEESEIKKEHLSHYVENNYIKYEGYIKNPEILLSSSTVFVLPSYGEGLPMSTLEAMSTGRPIITTSSAGCKETVIDGLNGFIVPIKNSLALADAMIEIMKNKERIIQFGNNSRLLAEEKFDETNINKRISVVIKENIS